jgi:hypothetical protein
VWMSVEKSLTCDLATDTPNRSLGKLRKKEFSQILIVEQYKCCVLDMTCHPFLHYSPVTCPDHSQVRDITHHLLNHAIAVY